MFHIEFLQFLAEAYEVRLAKIEERKLQKSLIIHSEAEMETSSNSKEWGQLGGNSSQFFSVGALKRDATNTSAVCA